MTTQPVNKWIVALSIAFGSLMATIDSSIVNVALPQIRGSVGATLEEITWISTSYIIAMVLIMPLTGILGAIFGQKNLYLGSLVLFILGSVLCGIAHTLPILILFRILQGLGAGSLQPSQQAILRQTFPPQEQGMAMALFSMVIMVGPAIGPTLGGWIIDNFNWPWIFYINLPVGILGIFMTWKNVHEPDDVKEANRVRGESLKTHMDWAGIILMVIAVSTLQYFLEEGPSKDWFESNVILATGLISAISFIALAIRELTFSHPVINLRLFNDPTFLSGTVISGVMFGVLMGSMFLLPVFMQELLGFNATMSGVNLMPRTLAMLAVTPVVGKLYNHVKPAYTVAVGVLLFIFGSFQLSHLTLQSSSSDIIIPLLITGVGLACLFVPLTTAALTHIPRHHLADAAGLNSFVRQIGGSVGLTIVATLLVRYGKIATSTVSWHISGLRPEVADAVAALTKKFSYLGPDQAQVLVTKMLLGRATLQGMVLAFDKAFLLQGIAFVVVLPMLFFLRVGKSAPAEKIEVHIE